jgi:hypothetical protein
LNATVAKEPVDAMLVLQARHIHIKVHPVDSLSASRCVNTRACSLAEMGRMYPAPLQSRVWNAAVSPCGGEADSLRLIFANDPD